MNIDTIQTKFLQDFDFDRVHKVMEALGWTWAQHDGCRTPTVDELKLFALGLVRQAIQDSEKTKKPSDLSSGGFVARVCASGTIELQFAVETCRVRSD